MNEQDIEYLAFLMTTIEKAIKELNRAMTKVVVEQIKTNGLFKEVNDLAKLKNITPEDLLERGKI